MCGVTGISLPCVRKSMDTTTISHRVVIDTGDANAGHGRDHSEAK
jgi:hypothetical protein